MIQRVSLVDQLYNQYAIFWLVLTNNTYILSLQEPPSPWSKVVFQLTAKVTIQSAYLPFFSQPDTPHGMRNHLDILLTLIVTITLTVAMLWPLGQPPPTPDGTDKVVHFITFAALAFPLAHTGRFGLLPVFISASAFGGIIELIQPTFNRGASTSDWIADTLGALIGICLGLAYRRVKDRRA